MSRSAGVVSWAGMSSFYEWVASAFGQDVAESRQRELDEQERQRADLERRQETYVGTTTPMRDRQSGSELDPTTGRPFERVVGGTEQHDASGWSWLSESWRWITGETTTTQGVNDETGRATLATSEQRSTASVRPDGTASYEHVDGTRTEVLDVAGLAGDARGQLTERRTAHTERLAEATAELASLDREREAAAPDQRAELDRRRDEVERRRQRLEGELAGLTRDLATLERTDLDEQALNGVLRSNGILLAPRYRTDVEHRETTSATLARSGVGATGALSMSSRDVQDGVTTTSTDTVRAGADLYSGTASASASSTVTEQRGGTTDTASMSTSDRVSASGGRVTASRSDEVSMSSADSDGNVTLGGSATRQRSGGIIASADELGVAAGRTDATSTTVDGVTRGRSDESSAQITDRGVRASASTDRTIGGSRTADGVTTTWGGGARTSRDGAFTVDVQPVAGSSPARYEVTMTLSAGAGVTLSGSAGRAREADAAAGTSARSASGSASAGATGSIELTYRHQMGEAEARAYMLEADQAEAGAATRSPEFGLVSRLRAILAEGDQAAAGGLAVLGSSGAAAELGAGESIELSLTGGISGELAGSASGGSFGGGVEAGGSLSATRRIKVERASEGEHQVDVTVTFVDASSSRLGGSATAFGATAGHRHSEAESQSEAATVRLDTSRPDYAEKYQTVCAAMSIDEVRALATRFTAASSTTSGDRTTMGAAGISLTVGTEATQSQEITRDLGEGRVSGTVSGGQTDSASLGTGASASERNTATTTVDGAGIDVRLEREEASTSPVRALEEGWQSLVTWWNGEHDGADVARAVATSPQERLTQQLNTTYSRLHEHSLGEADLDLLRGRAADTDNWTNCARSYRVYEAWRQLGHQLVSPQPDPDLAAINPQDATRLALATSLAHFMASHGRDGMAAMDFCLMRWGERGMTMSDAQDVGVMREWPSGIVGKRSSFMIARDRVRGADEHLTPLARAADGRSRAEAWQADTLHRLAEVETAIIGCHDFEHPRAKLEMLDEIARLRQELAAAMTRHLPVLEVTAELGGDPDAPMSREPTGDELTSRQPALMSTPETAETAPADRARMADLLRILRHFKTEEAAVFTRCRSMMRRELGGTIDGTWDYIRHGDESAAVLLVTEVGELHEAWIPRIVELREVYHRLGIAEDQWVVSSGPEQTRRSGYEPDVRTLVDIYMISDGSLALSDTGTRRGIARQWEARIRAY
jgi:hypothetical protein